MFKKITLVAAAAAAAAGTIPAAAQAHDNGYYGRSSYENRYDGPRYRRCSGTTGTILGAAAGALLGRAIDTRGSRITGTVIGGAGGAVLGRQVGRSTCRR